MVTALHQLCLPSTFWQDFEAVYFVRAYIDWRSILQIWKEQLRTSTYAFRAPVNCFAGMIGMIYIYQGGGTACSTKDLWRQFFIVQGSSHALCICDLALNTCVILLYTLTKYNFVLSKLTDLVQVMQGREKGRSLTPEARNQGLRLFYNEGDVLNFFSSVFVWKM